MKDLKEFLKSEKIKIDFGKKNNLDVLEIYNFDANESRKFLICSTFKGHFLQANKSIWISKEEKKFLEKNKTYNIIFPISVRWFWSAPKKFEEGKDDGYQCLIDFNKLAFIKIAKIKQRFVHLHNHFEFSQLDGVLNSKQWIEQCNIKGFTNLALTDHGTLAGSLEFFIDAKENGNVKPILGYEAYITEEKNLSIRGYDHLTLLARNNLGWKNLLKLNTFANKEGFYYKPRLTYEFLKERSKGLIILTGCPVSKMFKLLIIDKFKSAIKLYKYFCFCVGEENVYLEIQIHDFLENNIANKQDKFFRNLIRLKRKLKKLNLKPKIVLTNDCHYPKKSDIKVWNVINKISGTKSIEELSCVDLYLKTRKELLKNFEDSILYTEKLVKIKDFKEWCDNTFKIADKCNVDIPIGQYNLPEFSLKGTGFKNKEDLFNDIIQKGFDKKIINTWKKIQKDNNKKYSIKDYKDRIIREKRVIEKAGFINYFLIIWDIIKSAKENGIFVGNARGSVAGCLVAYCMDITEIDSIKFNLLFERFLNEARITASALYEIEFEDNTKIKMEGTSGTILSNKKLVEVKDLKIKDDVVVW